jgi:hypothetical protein
MRTGLAAGVSVSQSHRDSLGAILDRIDRIFQDLQHILFIPQNPVILSN